MKKVKDIKFPFAPKPLDKENKEIEVQCGVCGEHLIVCVGDPVTIHVDESGQVNAVLCTQCGKD